MLLKKSDRKKQPSFFPQEHTHTNKEGAIFNAGIVVNEIKTIKPGNLQKYLLH